MPRKKLKESWNEEVAERYGILKGIYDLYRRYHSLTDVKRISITPFESHYAEYLIAQKLIDEGFTIKGLQGKGYDIICNNRKIEVKSGRLQKHSIPRIKYDFWGWVVKKTQWDTPDHFDYLVCVALKYYEDRDGILAFSYEDVLKNFTKCDYEYLRYKRSVKDYLRLNLVKKGYDAFEDNVKIMRKEIAFKGKISPFEKELNKNPDQVFQDYSWEKFIKKFKS